MRNRARPWAVCLAALALAACADSSVSKPEVRLPAAFENAKPTTLAPAALDRWWTLFAGDRQLHDLVEQALISAPDARTALARVEEARALRAQRLASLWPQGNLSGSASHQVTEQQVRGSDGFGGFNTPGALNSLSARFDPTWEIDLFGRSRAGRRIANADYAAARFNAEATRMVLAADVARSLFQARALAVQLQDAQETVRISTELARVSGIRAERGLGTRADAARVQSDLLSAQAEELRLDAAARNARRSLLVLLGRGTDPLESLTVEAALSTPPAVPLTAPADLLARRPDVREAETRLRTAVDTARLSGLALLPTFTLQPSASISRNSGAFNSTTTMWSLGVGAMLPVLDRPRLLAVLRGDRARGEQAVIAFERAVQTAYGDAENAMSVLESDRTRLDRLAAGESQARFAYDAARRGYQAGLTDIVSLLDAERAWRASRTALSNTRSQALQDAVAAFQAIGGGWSPEMQTAVAGRTR